MKINKNIIHLYILFLLLFIIILNIISLILKIRLTILSPLYMLTPLASTIIIKFIKKIEFKDLGINKNFNIWFIIAWILPLILSFTTLFVSLLLPGVKFSYNMNGMLKYGINKDIIIKNLEKYNYNTIKIIINLIIKGLIYGPTINTIFAIGEEIGWRGLLFKELNSFGFWKTSYIIGVLWGLWHIPLIISGHNYPGHPIAGVPLMIIFCITLSPLLNLIRIKSKSLIAPSIFHGTLNAFAGIPIIFTEGNILLVSIQGITGIFILIIINILIFILYKRLIPKENI